MATFLTPRQVAERWACSTRTVERLCHSGELPAMRLGLHRWRIGLAAVEAYELAHTSGTTESAPSIEARKAEPIRPVFGALEETGRPLGERWWEDDDAASSAVGRGRSTGTKKTAPVGGLR